ncbi:MAG: phosphotransferase family protein [Cytophagales bacterium]|nr:phosphotransferase family protein [Bernardetiaceae bacterium]MDW8210898.1 phosphotransferase family protein [Cytophagales bacterium]
MRFPIDQPGAVRPGEELNISELSAFLKQHFPQQEASLTIEQFPAGFSNLTYLIRWGKKELVLRRPPFGVNIQSAHDMRREYEILRMLEPVYAKVPKPLVYTNDTSIIGAEFYLMERLHGVILRHPLPQIKGEQLRAVSISIIQNLADLHAIDIYKTGLVHIGKPEGYVQRQVEGWIKRYQKSAIEPIESLHHVAEWLQAHLPAENAPALIHNDYKYDNLLLNPNNLTEVIAVLDWEMATVGDPLMDLGTTLAYWADEDSPSVLKRYATLTALAGNLNREEVAQVYAQASGRDISHLLFYYVFGCYKVAVIAQQIYARYKKGLTQDKRFADLIHVVKACGESAANAIKFGRVTHWK